MILVLVTAAVVSSVALLRGGSLKNLAETRFAWTWVLIGALVLQIGAETLLPGDLANRTAGVIVLISYVGAALFMALNNRLPGMAIAAAGLALNSVVIVRNGAMPVSQWAARIAGVGTLSGNIGAKHEIAGPDTSLRFLGDVIPIPNTLQIVSIGDVVLAIGLAILVYRQTLHNHSELPARRASG